MSKAKPRPQLRRYTDLPALIYMLSNRVLTLLDPNTWDDKNDSRYLNLYKKKAKLKSLLALCFTEDAETYHHWRIFAPGSGGVCVIFKRSTVDDVVKNEPDAILKKVRYLKLVERRKRPLRRIELLNSKRYAFHHESEVRLLFRSETKEVTTHDLPFALTGIERITLSPWLHPTLRQGVTDHLHGIKGCSSLPIYRSTLIGNEEWRKLGEAAD